MGFLSSKTNPALAPKFRVAMLYLAALSKIILDFPPVASFQPY
jgi:hypothetical protein